MDRELIIRLAREAGLGGIFEQYSGEFSDGNPEVCLEELERFVALVAAEKDKEIKLLAKALKQEQKKNDELISIMSGGVELAVRLAVKAEREECAKVCDEYNDGRYANTADLCAAAIRSRT